jgi:hypothetical protein
MEPGEVKKYYQWQSGFRQGEVEVYLAETEKEVYFESGKSVSKDDFTNMMIEIPQEIYEQKTANQKSQQQQFTEWESLLGNPTDTPAPPPTAKSTPPPPPKEQNPIELILSKQKKVKSKPWTISIDLPIPEAKILDFLTMMFDEDEVMEAVVNSAFKDISLDDIKAKVKEQLMPEPEEIESEPDKYKKTDSDEMSS